MYSIAPSCDSLTDHVGDDSSEICKYLIAKCPKSVRVSDNNYSELPIHFFLDDCQHRVVKEVVVSLLQEYTESYDMATYIGEVPNSVPFIQHIKPLLDEERELKDNVAYLQEVSGMFQDAVDGTENPSILIGSTCNTFVNWATVTTIQRLEAKMEEVLTELQDECNAD